MTHFRLHALSAGAKAYKADGNGSSDIALAAGRPTKIGRAPDNDVRCGAPPVCIPGPAGMRRCKRWLGSPEASLAAPGGQCYAPLQRAALAGSSHWL